MELIQMRNGILATSVLAIILISTSLGTGWALEGGPPGTHGTEIADGTSLPGTDVQAVGPPLPGFTVNAGQFPDPLVAFYAELSGGGFAFKSDSVLVNIELPIDEDALGDGRESIARAGPYVERFQNLRYSGVHGCTVELIFEGSRDVTPEGVDEVAGVRNYIRGGDPRPDITGVRSYLGVVYEDLYAGIDLLYRMTPDGIKYEFILDPGADPGIISVLVDGHERLSVAGGDLVIGTPVDDIRDVGLVVYYADDPEERVPAAFDVRGPDRYGFTVEGRDADRTLVIDPLVFSTFLGTDSFDWSTAIDVDDDGNSIVAGYTMGSAFPTTTGAYQETHNHVFDVFVTKVSADGSTLLFSTFLGGPSDDVAQDVAIDGSGRVFVCGYTTSGGFPTTNKAYQRQLSGMADGFVSVLSSDGTQLLASTFLGRSNDDLVTAIDVGASGGIHVTGVTYSYDFPVSTWAPDKTMDGLFDIFVSKFNSSLSELMYSTYLGGESQDDSNDIVVDDDGTVYVGGSTRSRSFPASEDAFQKDLNGAAGAGFITRVAANGSAFLNSTYLGGTLYQEVNAVCLDANGDVHAIGSTTSSDFPVTKGAFQTVHGDDSDAFVTRMDGNLTTIVTSTFIGDEGEELGLAGALDPVGNVVLCGSTFSPDFPVTQGAAQTQKGAFVDGFMTKLGSDYADLVYSSFLGSVDSDEAVGVAVLGTLNVYITGTTFSDKFPTTDGAFQTVHGGGPDTFVSRFTMDREGPVAVAGDDVFIDQFETVEFNGSGSHDNYGIANWTWTFVYGGDDVEFHGPYFNWTFDDAGHYRVTLEVKDTAFHRATDTINVTVRDITAPTADAGNSKWVPQGTTVVLDGSGSSDNVGIVSWNWSFAYQGEDVVLTGEVASFEFEDAGDYEITLTVRDAVDLEATDIISVHVEDTTGPVADAGEDITVDQHEEFELDGSGSWDNVGIVNWTWSFVYAGVPEELQGEVVLLSFDIVGTHQVILRVEDATGFYSLDTVNVIVRDSTPPTAVAGPDREVDQHMTVSFDGTASVDNVAIVSYAWTFEYGGSPIVLVGAQTTFAFDLVGIYAVTLEVTDAEGNVGYASLNITVKDVTLPTADAGDDKLVDQGAVVTFDGLDSSDNAGVVTFSWTFQYGGALQSLEGGTPSFTFDDAGVYVVTLIVTDVGGNTDDDELTITVKDTTAPEVPVMDDLSVDQGTPVDVSASGASDNVGVTSYTWTFLYSGAPVSLSGSTMEHTFDVPGVYEVTLTVADAEGNEASTTFTVTVRDTESPVALVKGTSFTAGAGETVRVDASGSSDNVGVVRWTWTFEEGGSTVTREGPVLEHAFDEPGTYEVTLTVEDAGGNTDTETVTVTVEGSSMLWVLAVGLVVVVAAVAAFAMMRRRGGAGGEG